MVTCTNKYCGRLYQPVEPARGAAPRASAPARERGGHARDISARPIEAGDDTQLDRVVAHVEDKAEEIAGVVLPANEDPALPLNPGEEALDAACLPRYSLQTILRRVLVISR
jgi:hypothetical protein